MRNTKWILVCGLIFAVLLWTAYALAVEVPTVSPVDFPVGVPPVDTSPEAHWFWTLLSSDAVYNAWLWCVTFLATSIMGWLKWENTRKGKAIYCITEGIKTVGDIWVRAIKNAREDGKLTEDERKRANAEAIDFACAYAREQGFNLMSVFAKEILPSIIDKYVRKLKGESAQSKIPLVYSLELPDLVP